MIRKTMFIATAAAALSVSAGSSAMAEDYRFTVESGYSFKDNTLVHPDGRTETGDKADLYKTYGLIGADNSLMRTIFQTPDGKKYQVGYRIERQVLHFPTGAVHAMGQASPEDATKALTEAYGLVGKPERMVRTKW